MKYSDNLQYPLQTQLHKKGKRGRGAHGHNAHRLKHIYNIWEGNTQYLIKSRTETKTGHNHAHTAKADITRPCSRGISWEPITVDYLKLCQTPSICQYNKHHVCIMTQHVNRWRYAQGSLPTIPNNSQKNHKQIQLLNYLIIFLQINIVNNLLIILYPSHTHFINKQSFNQY